MRIAVISIITLLYTLRASAGSGLITPFERSSGRQTATWREAVDFYKALDAYSPDIEMSIIGRADGNYPLHVVYYSANGRFNVTEWQKDGKVIILINNAIHAGEPDGVDASMMLLRDIAEGKYKIPDNVVLAVIPVFNVGGAVNRNSHSRANQNGPESYGFRGNAQNLDLNRDFMKADALETQSLQRLFTKLDPDILIDNHVSDGADYQHVMTLLPTQHDKLGKAAGKLLYNKLVPQLYGAMERRKYDLVPYVNNFDNTPERGWTAFFEPPRFLSGYAALFQCFGFVVETHMLKPFDERVKATRVMMEEIINMAADMQQQIKVARASDRDRWITETTIPLAWSVDTSLADKVTFKGYTSGYKKSEVSGLQRLYYDRNKPFTKTVPYLDHFVKASVALPKAYIIPRGWNEVLKRLRINGVEMSQLDADTTIKVTCYQVTDYTTIPRPYERHYLHSGVKVVSKTEQLTFHKGDYMVPTGQRAVRYIVEALEPTANDGFFAWNFFDGILSQKEYFGDYVFEDLAADLLKKDPKLKEALQQRQQSDTAFARSADAQLNYIYKNAGFMEQGFMRIPVFRVE